MNAPFAPGFTHPRGPWSSGHVYTIDGPGGPYGCNADADGLYDVWRTADAPGGPEQIASHRFTTPDDALAWLEEREWLRDLENEVRALHGFGWGEAFPRRRDTRQSDLFQPMCVGCAGRAA